MAVSAFKSTSKRGNFAAASNTTASTSSAKERQTEDLGKKLPSRRSRSVSAVSRSRLEASAAPSASDFLNKRDNPLFCTSSTSPTDSEKSIGTVERSSDTPDGSRGRSVSRCSGFGSQDSGHRKELGRSLSRVDTGRGEMGRSLSRVDTGRREIGRSLSRVDTGRRHRSVSRGHYGNSESETEQECRLASNLRNMKIGNYDSDGQKQTNSTANEDELLKQTRKLQTWSSQHPLSEPLDGASPSVQRLNMEDAISTSSLSEAEEKTIKAVFEQIKSFQCDHPSSDAGSGGIYETVRSEVRRAVSEIRNDLENAIRRKNPAIITIADVADIPPELVNPDAIELVSDIRREYTAKLEQSQERARRLRADLDVEEQRGEEISRILKEILPDPKSSDSQKSRPRRKTSIERRKVSRRLAEEAMNYFDECVSISTFESSDFSSPEDPPLSTVVTTQMGSNRNFSNRDSSSSMSHFPSGSLNRHEEFGNLTHCSHSFGGSNLTSSNSFSSVKSTNPMQANDDRDNLVGFDTPKSENYEFSFAREPLETVGVHDIRHYIWKFEKELPKDDAGQENVRSSYIADDYDSNVSSESFLFERMILKRRIDSGGLLICDVRSF